MGSTNKAHKPVGEMDADEFERFLERNNGMATTPRRESFEPSKDDWQRAARDTTRSFADDDRTVATELAKLNPAYRQRSPKFNAQPAGDRPPSSVLVPGPSFGYSQDRYVGQRYYVAWNDIEREIEWCARDQLGSSDVWVDRVEDVTTSADQANGFNRWQASTLVLRPVDVEMSESVTDEELTRFNAYYGGPPLRPFAEMLTRRAEDDVMVRTGRRPAFMRVSAERDDAASATKLTVQAWDETWPPNLTRMLTGGVDPNSIRVALHTSPPSQWSTFSGIVNHGYARWAGPAVDDR